MSNSPEFVVLRVVRTDRNEEFFVRNETHQVSNIQSMREWHNKGEFGKKVIGKMTEITFKSPIVDDDDKAKNTFKVKVTECFDELSVRIGAAAAPVKETPQVQG